MLHTIRRTQVIKSDLDTVWDFLKLPANLEKITPEFMGFEVLGNIEDFKQMYPGQVIEYFVRPLFGIKMHWVTEITHVENKKYFVDEQRFGPYSFWHHKHFLREVSGGVEMTDIIHYRLPYGFIGKLVNKLFVAPKLNQIFDFRFNALEKFYNVRQ